MRPNYRLMAPEDDLAGGGAADPSGGDAGNDVGADAGGGGSAPTIEDTARNTYRALMNAAGGESEVDAGEEGEGGEDEPRHKSQPRVNGKFAKQGEQAQGEAAAEGGEDEAAAAAAAAAAQTKPHDAYPNTWQRELQGEWTKLPEKVREQIHKRESDFHNGIREYKDAAGFGSTMAKEFMPYQQLMRDRGVTPHGLVRDILGTLKNIVTGSEESRSREFLKLATDYGVNLDQVLSLRQRAPAPAAGDLSPVLQRVQQLETRISEADQERQRLQAEEDERRVTAFLNDPKNEHAKAVSREMAALLKSGEAQDLQEAYEKAIWVHGPTREKLLAKQEAERVKKEAEQAAAARKAASSNVNRRGTPPARAKPSTMEDTARSVYRKLTASS